MSTIWNEIDHPRGRGGRFAETMRSEGTTRLLIAAEAPHGIQDQDGYEQLERVIDTFRNVYPEMDEVSYFTDADGNEYGRYVHESGRVSLEYGAPDGMDEIDGFSDVWSKDPRCAGSTPGSVWKINLTEGA